jgi:hypothetical protein
MKNRDVLDVILITLLIACLIILTSLFFLPAYKYVNNSDGIRLDSQ